MHPVHKFLCLFPNPTPCRCLRSTSLPLAQVLRCHLTKDEVALALEMKVEGKKDTRSSRAKKEAARKAGKAHGQSENGLSVPQTNPEPEMKSVTT